MRKRTVKTLMLVAMLLLSVVTFAVPADKKPVTIKQANGKTLTFVLQGDERVNWATTLDGYTLILNEKGQWTYAQKDEKGNMVASKFLACNKEERSNKEIAFLNKTEKDLRYSQTQIKARMKYWQPKNTDVKATERFFPSEGKDSLLVILVAFKDLDFTYTAEDFDSMCNQSNWNGTGSIRDYFLINSDSVLDLNMRVVGPYTLKNNMAYYGNTSTNPFASYNFVNDAVIAAANDGVNFANFDNDGDGWVDDVCFIFAGTPESSTGNVNEIWPHSGNMETYEPYGYGVPYKNEKKVGRYTCSAEMRSNGTKDNIGTFCHEFGHALGLPDEYDTDYGGKDASGKSITNKNVAVTTESWSVMCNGSYNNDSKSPALWSAGQKIRTGWIKNIDTLDSTRDSVLLPVLNGHNDTAYRVNLNNNEFLIIEHRKKQGFDAYIPGEGMLIFHGQMDSIDRWKSDHANTINVNPQQRGWFIECADGVDNKVNDKLNHINTGHASFPGLSNVTYFTNDSPNKASYVNGDPMDIAITNIHYVNDSMIMFNFNSSAPHLITETAGSIGATKAELSGKVAYFGNGYTAKGIVYSTDEDCPYDESFAVKDETDSDSSAINVVLEGLQSQTDYYFRAFALYGEGKVALGDIKTLKTSTGYGIVLTKAASDITENSAKITGDVKSLGEGEFVEKGFLYSQDKDAELTLENADIMKLSSTDTAKGQYSETLTGLSMAETYYFRAYITNSFGTYYGTTQNFQTTYPAITNNTIGSSQALCLGSTPAQLTGETPEGGLGNFTYRWEQKKSTGTWIEAEGTNNQQNYQPSALTDSTYFRRVVISDGKAENVSNEVLIDIMISRGGVITVSDETINKGEEVTLTLLQSRGTIIDWERAKGSDSFSGLGLSANKIDETLDEDGTFTYRVKVQIEQCEPAYSKTASVTVLSSSITDAQSDIVLDIMPNPTSNGTFVINAEMHAQLLTVTNALGQTVYIEKNVDLTNKTVTLDAENGTYMINIVNNGEVISRKLIINK